MLKQLTLKNFKCFADERFDLGALNILTGLNGMGKSTVLQALLLLRQNFDFGLLQSGEGIALNGELIQIGNARDLLNQYYKKPEIHLELKTDDDVVAQWTLDAKTVGDHLEILDKPRKLSQEMAEEALFSSNFHYLNAERLGPRVYFETSNFNVLKKNQLGIHGEYTANYLAEFQSAKIPIEALNHPKATGLSLGEQVNAWMSEIRPGTRIDINTNLDMSLVGLTYQFIGGMDAGNRFRPTNVGFGLSFLLPLLVAVLSAKPGTLLLLENPEAHLHPRGQSEIGKLLAIAAANGVQIITETHSDHVLNGVRVAVKKGRIEPEQARVLFFHGETIDDQFTHYVLNPKIDKDGRIDQWPDGFFDEWDRQLLELL